MVTKQKCVRNGMVVMMMAIIIGNWRSEMMMSSSVHSFLHPCDDHKLYPAIVQRECRGRRRSVILSWPWMSLMVSERRRKRSHVMRGQQDRTCRAMKAFPGHVQFIAHERTRESERKSISLYEPGQKLLWQWHRIHHMANPIPFPITCN